ncbi:MAG: hypothetical protein KIT72_13255 [Polyangiaceae bacterium]|nr:hypothetical protein [Polyangiaceae bacterium]MCW5791379.1 hypothetical protein [Polyangiaceae bacterium]
MSRPAPPPKPPKPPPSATTEVSQVRPLAESGGLSGPLTDSAKEQLTIQALGIRNEQVQARIIHYKGDLETSPELDAVTAQVVAQLKAMQAAIEVEPAVRESTETIEAGQITLLSRLLARVFTKDEQSSLITQNLKTIGRRVAKLFFESELHEKTKGDKEKTIHHAEQGVYYVLSRYKNRISAELDGFDYVDEDIKQLTFELLTKIERDLQVGFLSRRSPEMKRVMQDYTAVLLEFFQSHLPPRVEQMARVTIRAAGTARQPNSVSYKVHADCFPQFRAEWERLFVEQMVNFCGDALMARLEQTDEQIREETVKFFTDPHVFSETCEVVCDALYDFLCLEGMLDLPVDWRVKLGREAG